MDAMTTKQTADIPVIRDENLHLRPMQLLTERATGFQSRVLLTRGKRKADAKSILDVMMLASEKGPLHLEAEGDDAEAAVRSIVYLLREELKI